MERRWRWWLAALLLLDLALLAYMGRRLTFYYDEWEFIIRDWGEGLHFMLLAHVGNLAFFPAAGYKLLFHLVGIGHYEYYRLLVVVLHLIAATLVFVLAQRRVSKAPALLAAAFVLFLGAAWEDLLWAFQFGYLLSMVAGLAALLLLERDDRRGDVGAMLCLIVALGSASIGIAFTAGVAVELAWRRRWPRMLTVLATPVLLYLVWYLSYGESQVSKESVIHAPGFLEDVAATAFGGLVGRGLDWGRPLALVCIVALLFRLIRTGRISARLAGLLATALALWTIIALARSVISPPESSRYIYLGAVAIVLIAVECLAGVRISPRAVVAAGAVALLAALTGLTLMRIGADGLRGTSETVTAELGALQLAGAYAPAEYQPDPVLAPPVMAGAYLHTVRSIGSSPGQTPARIASGNSVARAAADKVLVALEPPSLRPSRVAKPVLASVPPHVLSTAGATISKAGECAVVRPTATPATTVLALPLAGVLVENSGSAPITLAARRFGDTFASLAGSAARDPSELVAPRDAASASHPWQIQISLSSPVRLCALAGG